MKGGLNKSVSVRVQGDVYSLWKPVNELLGSSNSKATVTLNLHNRRARRISHGVLEVLVEAMSTHVDWKLKLNGVNITREFKPLFLLELPEQNKYFCKFVYDITELLNTDEATSREWANVTVKHEGGNPLNLKGVLLNAIYDDSEATSTYSHITGLLLLEKGDEYSLNLEQFTGDSDVHAKLILYTPRACKVLVSTESRADLIALPHNQVEEYVLPLGDHITYIKASPQLDENQQGYLVLSSITVYSTRVKIPRLNIEDIEAFKQGSNIRVKLKIVNTGESRPDKIIISVLDRGVLLGMYRFNGLNYEPGKLVEEELLITGTPQTAELTLRVAWSKLTRTMFTDRKITLS